MKCAEADWCLYLLSINASKVVDIPIRTSFAYTE